MLSGITVADGVVYAGSEDKNVHALRADNGQKLWQFTTGGVAGGIVCAGSTDNNVYALRA